MASTAPPCGGYYSDSPQHPGAVPHISGMAMARCNVWPPHAISRRRDSPAKLVEDVAGHFGRLQSKLRGDKLGRDSPATVSVNSPGSPFAARPYSLRVTAAVKCHLSPDREPATMKAFSFST